jgi:hypothetical protein
VWGAIGRQGGGLTIAVGRWRTKSAAGVGADQPVGRPRATGDHGRCAGAQLWMRRVQESRPPVSSSQLMTA